MTEIESLKKLEKQKSKLASKPFCSEGKQKNKFYSLVVFQVLGGKFSLKNELNSNYQNHQFQTTINYKIDRKEITTANSKHKNIAGFVVFHSSLLAATFLSGGKKSAPKSPTFHACKPLAAMDLTQLQPKYRNGKDEKIQFLQAGKRANGNQKPTTIFNLNDD